MKELKERYRRFREWQERPYEVAAMSEEEHECKTCHTVFTGNYCPRCGQSSRIGRYSFKKAFLLFLDVWGLGNRGMFRTLRDLLLRPGYMIRDYLKGMQMAYFPPFKMLFLLTALSLVIAHGMNIQGKTYDKEVKGVIEIEVSDDTDKESKGKASKVLADITDVQERFPNIITLMGIVIFSLVLYPAFRHNRNIPDMRFSEFLITMVYSANMTTIYESVLTFFCASTSLVGMVSLLILIPLKQMSGYTWKQTILRTAVPMAVAVILLIALIFAVILVFNIVGVTSK